MNLNNFLHRNRVGEFNVVEEASSKKRIRELFFIVTGNNDDRTGSRLNHFFGFVDKKFHFVQFQQKIIGKLYVCLVNLIDQQNRLLFRLKGLPDLSLNDVIRDVLDFIIAELRVSQSGHRIILVQTLLRFCC